MSLLHLLHIRSRANSSLPEATGPCRYQYEQTRCPLTSAVNNSADAMSGITQPIATGPNHIDPWQRWCGLLASLVGAKSDQDGPLIPWRINEIQTHLGAGG